MGVGDVGFSMQLLLELMFWIYSTMNYEAKCRWILSIHDRVSNEIIFHVVSDDIIVAPRLRSVSATANRKGEIVAANPFWQ